MHVGTCTPKTALGVPDASAWLLQRSPRGKFCYYLHRPAEETTIKNLVRGDQASLWESQERNPAPSDPGALTDHRGKPSDRGKEKVSFSRKPSFSTPPPAHRIHLGGCRSPMPASRLRRCWFNGSWKPPGSRICFLKIENHCIREAVIGIQ